MVFCTVLFGNAVCYTVVERIQSVFSCKILWVFMIVFDNVNIIRYDVLYLYHILPHQITLYYITGKHKIA